MPLRGFAGEHRYAKFPLRYTGTQNGKEQG